MSTSTTFDHLLGRVTAGERLSPDDLAQLAAAPDILAVGMLADAVRRRLHGTRVTFVRVASLACDAARADEVPPTAREVRVTGSPASLDAAVGAVQRAKAAAGPRAVSAFSWSDIVRLASGGGLPPGRVLADLRAAGLEALAEIPIDTVGDEAAVLDALRDAGFDRVRLTFECAPAADRTARMLRAAGLQDRLGGIQALNPLPTVLHPARPTTGYDDVKAVAVARLAAPNIPTIQVDWQRYGPKLAQVALTFGADDFDNVTVSDEAPDGRRRAPMEDVRRNIEAAGFSAAERDGSFNVLTT